MAFIFLLDQGSVRVFRQFRCGRFFTILMLDSKWSSLAYGFPPSQNLCWESRSVVVRSMSVLASPSHKPQECLALSSTPALVKTLENSPDLVLVTNRLSLCMGGHSELHIL